MIAVEQFPDAFASAICDNIAGCCDAASLPYDAAGCRARMDQALASLTAAASLPNVTWNASAAGACVEQAAAVATQCGDLMSVTICNQLGNGILSPGDARAARNTSVGCLRVVMRAATRARASRSLEARWASRAPRCVSSRDPRRSASSTRSRAWRTATRKMGSTAPITAGANSCPRSENPARRAIARAALTASPAFALPRRRTARAAAGTSSATASAPTGNVCPWSPAIAADVGARRVGASALQLGSHELV